MWTIVRLLQRKWYVNAFNECTQPHSKNEVVSTRMKLKTCICWYDMLTLYLPLSVCVCVFVCVEFRFICLACSKIGKKDHKIGLATGGVLGNIYSHLNSLSHIKNMPKFLKSDSSQPKLYSFLDAKSKLHTDKLSDFLDQNMAAMCYGMEPSGEAEELNHKFGPLTNPTTYTADRQVFSLRRRTAAPPKTVGGGFKSLEPKCAMFSPFAGLPWPGFCCFNCKRVRFSEEFKRLIQRRQEDLHRDKAILLGTLFS